MGNRPSPTGQIELNPLSELELRSRRRDYSLTPLRRTVRADCPHTAPQGNLLIHCRISHRVRFVNSLTPALRPEEVSPTLRSPCQPLRSIPFPGLHHYYELVRLPRSLLEFLTSSARCSIPPCGGILALPSSSQIIEYMSPSQTPVGVHSLAHITAASLLPSRSLHTVGSPRRDIFGAQSVHPKLATCILPVYASTGSYLLHRKTRYYPAG